MVSRRSGRLTCSGRSEAPGSAHAADMADMRVHAAVASVDDQFMVGTDASFRIVGGANLPTMRLRMNATWPLAVLTINNSRVSIRLRGPLQRTGGVPLDGTPAEIAEVFQVRSMWSRGVGFTDRSGREWYFWTRRVQPILAMLDARGYRVTNVPKKAVKVWKAVP
jgi:hypothetical protein